MQNAQNFTICPHLPCLAICLAVLTSTLSRTHCSGFYHVSFPLENFIVFLPLSSPLHCPELSSLLYFPIQSYSKCNVLPPQSSLGLDCLLFFSCTEELAQTFLTLDWLINLVHDCTDPQSCPALRCLLILVQHCTDSQSSPALQCFLFNIPVRGCFLLSLFQHCTISSV
jgi:hypothetical protein